MPVNNFKAVFTLIVFILTNALVIFPFSIPLPRLKLINRTLRLPVDFRTTPVAAVILLLATRCISGDEVRKGIVGSDGVQSLDIMALFISLAYLAISLDQTGLLRFLAFWVAAHGGSSGIRLYIAFYALFFGLGTIVGNDPVILSGTPFLAYFTKETQIEPRAWIFAQFTVANIASAILVSSNPTNLVLTGGFSISFFTYTAKLIIPVIAAAFITLPVLLFVFRGAEHIPKTLERIDVIPSSVLVDPKGAVFGAVLLIITLCTLVATSFLHPPVWMVTVPPTIIMIIRDVLYDLGRKSNLENEHEAPVEKELSTVGQTAPEHTPAPKATRIVKLQRRLPTLFSILSVMPFALLPFAFSMFILVQGLVSTGWVDIWAEWWTKWTEISGPIGAIAAMGFISCILCNLFGTNIGATILLTRVLQAWVSKVNPHSRLLDGSVFALALGSNYGAFTFSFSASLAGLLWRRILLSKDISVTMWQFAKFNLLPVAAAMSVSSAVLVAQVYIIYKSS